MFQKMQGTTIKDQEAKHSEPDSCKELACTPVLSRQIELESDGFYLKELFSAKESFLAKTGRCYSQRWETHINSDHSVPGIC